MNKIYDLEGKNKAIVVFKFFAALLITYSHMGLLFPKFGGLVTGGAIGDGVFFFCSGFTLFLGRDGGFLNWYKRRVGRILSVYYNVGIVVCRGFRLGLVGYGCDNHSKVLVHSLHYGLLCYILCDSSFYDKSHEYGFYRFVGHYNHIEFFCS